MRTCRPAERDRLTETIKDRRTHTETDRETCGDRSTEI